MSINVKGVDLSTFNTQVDFIKAKKSGIRFAILRAGFGSLATQVDKRFRTHINGALEAKMDVGAYWFSYARSAEEARAEARTFLSVMKEYAGKVTYPLYCDYEYASIEYAERFGIKPDKKLITDIIVAFCEEIKKAGWYPGYYTNLDFIRNRLDMERLKPYDLWLADYTDGPSYNCGMQQTSSTGKVEGIVGNVDLDTAFRDYPAIIRKCGCNGFKPQPSCSVEGICTQNNTKLYEAAYTTARLVGTADKNDSLCLLADDGWGWSKVRVTSSGLTGWMENTAVSGPNRSRFRVGSCIGNDVNIRQTPSLTGKILGQFNKGAKFTMVSIDPSNWIDIGYGYLYYDKSYIQL